MARQRHLKITVEGKVYDVLVEEISDEDNTFYPSPDLANSAQPRTSQASAAAPSARPAPAPGPAAGAAPSGAEKLAPLGGMVLEVSVREGDKVKTGDQVVVLESMKMKQVISAHRDGTVTKVHVQSGQAVDAGQPLVTIG